ncbi:transcription factor CP2-like protein 1 isoform X4 [Leptopilina boulardi]|uniref:transcription factor CP2-like protein 1 isoform X4 n=1 Tax=Leptopilina boulardi TaxID=63433 RepID=UPI0021F545EC|nr:transcription factor CP2-like protein 1 isoform X4 [Leptopilina boulardi]
MELQLIMDTGPETLSGAMWLNSNSSPSFQQVTSSHQNVCEGITAQSMGYHGPSNELWQEKRNMVKNSPESESQIRSNNASPHNNSTSIVLNQTKNLLKRTAEDSLQQIEEIDRKHARTEGSVGSNGSGQGWTTQVEELAEHLAADFDNSLSALAASDLATAVASYNMSLNHVSQRSVNVAPTNNGNVGLLDPDSNNNGQNAPSLHQLLYNSNEEYPPTSSSTNHVSSSQQGYESNEDCRFQYVLAAATSIATKVNEETLTYLNQGQSYEIKLKKLGDLSAYRGKILKGDPTFLFQSTIRICFHERRLQYTEREQILAWQRARPGERLLEVDVPLSYGMVDVCQPSPTNNSVDFMWDPTKEVGVYVKINCISTEFTPKKHGGEKGVPFRIQVETRFPDGSRLHGASCQVKVFKLKGADRKHKQDRDKILKRPPHEQDKYQPSYDCTVLSDIPLESLSSSTSITQNAASPYAPSEAISPQSRTTISGNSSPISTPLSLSVGNTGVLPIITASESVKEDPIPAAALPSPAAIISEQPDTNIVSYPLDLSPDANASQTSAWLRGARFQNFESTFANFSASDILRLSRDDLIQICGLADGIRLYNALHSKAPAPKLSLYFSIEGNNSLWRVVYLESLTSASLTSKLVKTLNLPQERLHSMLLLGPQGIHILVTNELVANMKDENMYFVETIKDVNSDRYKLLLKPSSC